MGYKSNRPLKPLNSVAMWNIKGLNGVKPIKVKCPLENCNHETINKNGMIGHLCTSHNKADLIKLLISIIEGGYVK